MASWRSDCTDSACFMSHVARGPPMRTASQHWPVAARSGRDLWPRPAQRLQDGPCPVTALTMFRESPGRVGFRPRRAISMCQVGGFAKGEVAEAAEDAETN